MRFIIACVSLVLLTACVAPLRMTVYEPTCPKGAAISCMQQDDKLIIELSGGAKVNVEANLLDVRQKANKTISMCISVQLERGSTFQFLSSSIVLESSTWSAPRAVDIRKITGPPGPRSYAAGEKINGVVSDAEMIQDALQSPNALLFWLWFESTHNTLCETSIPIVTEFTLRMPDVLVNGQKTHIPPVYFTREKKWDVRGLCC